MQVLPTNVAVAGFALTWEPFDWGRRHNRVREKSNTLAQAHNGAQEAESQIGVEVAAEVPQVERGCVVAEGHPHRS